MGVVREPTVGKHKGKVESRRRGRLASEKREVELVSYYAQTPVETRLALAMQWARMNDAGVPLCVLSAEYKVSMTTIGTAMKDPEKWAYARRGSHSAGSKEARRARHEAHMEERKNMARKVRRKVRTIS